MKRLLWLLGNVARYPMIGLLGVKEFKSSVGMTYDNDPTSPRSGAYDSGRELAHMITGRRHEA